MKASDSRNAETYNTADSNDLQDLLDESHALLRATANFKNELLTINKIQNTSAFMSDHEKISNILQTSGLNMKSLRDFINKEEQIQQKELGTIRDQFLHIPVTTKSDPSTLLSESSIPTKHDGIKQLKTTKISKQIFHDDSDSSSSSNSSNSSSDSSDSENDLTNKLRQILQIKNTPKSTKTAKRN